MNADLAGLYIDCKVAIGTESAQQIVRAIKAMLGIRMYSHYVRAGFVDVFSLQILLLQAVEPVVDISERVKRMNEICDKDKYSDLLIVK